MYHTTNILRLFNTILTLYSMALHDDPAQIRNPNTVTPRADVPDRRYIWQRSRWQHQGPESAGIEGSS